MARKSTSNTDSTERPKRHAWNEITLGPEELERCCDTYFEWCEERGKNPSKEGLSVYIGILPDTFDRWVANKDSRHAKHAAVLKKALAIISDGLQQRKDPMAIFLSKQPCYGGYSDKPSNVTPTSKIILSFEGKSG